MIVYDGTAPTQHERTLGPGPRVVAEVFPGAAALIEAHARERGGWICEAHPDKPWPHDDCAGPGKIHGDT